jgi:hypothetical protein
MRRLETMASSGGENDSDDDGDITRRLSLRSDSTKNRRHLAGCFRVRCVGASDLQTSAAKKRSTANLFANVTGTPGSQLDPYMQLVLTDDGHNVSKRRTHTI